MFIFYRGKSFRLLCIALIAPFCGIFGQQYLSLANLTDSASRHLPLLMQKRALVNSARAAVTDARHGFIPALRANIQSGLGTDNSLPGSYNSFGIVPSTSSGVRIENDMQSSLGTIGILHGEYDLVDFGYRKATIARASSFAGLQTAEFDRSLYAVKTDIARIYFTLLKKQAQLEIDQQNMERYTHIFEVIRALTLSGLKPGADSSLAKAELSKSMISYNQTLGAVDQLKEQLAYYTGIRSNKIEIDTIPIRHIERNLDYFSDTTHPDANPLIVYYFKQQQLNASNEKWIAKSYLPRIYLVASAWARGSSISPGDEYKSLSTGLGFQRYNYLAGFTIQYDLFDGLHKNDKLRIYHDQTEASSYDLQQQQLALQSASTQADLSIHTNEINLAELPVQINAAKDTYDQKMAQYKAGIISLIDLTNAAFVLYRSLNDYSETLSDWYLAHLDKAMATGSLDNFIKSVK